MIRILLFIVFFPFAIIYYSVQLILSIVLGFLKLLGLVDIFRKL